MVVTVFVEILFGFDEFVVYPESKLAFLWSTQTDCPAGLVYDDGMAMRCGPVSERPTGTEYSTARANVSIATENYPSIEPPSVVVFVEVIIRFEPMMQADGEEVEIENPTLHVGTFG